MLAVFMYVFLRSIIRHYKHNQRLHRSLRCIEVESIESERKRIVTELHDGIAPIITSIKVIISGIPANNRADVIAAEKAMQNTDILLERLRETYFNLRPSGLTRQGLVAAIGEWIDDLNETTKLRWTFRYDDGIEIPYEASLNIYRIVQEGIHNILKHADAHECCIVLQKKNRQYILMIQDDGKGFTAYSCKGYGLNNIALRTEALHGKFYLDTKPGKGTTIQIDIPIIHLKR